MLRAHCLRQTDDQQQKYLREVYNLIVKRDDSLVRSWEPHRLSMNNVARWTVCHVFP